MLNVLFFFYQTQAKNLKSSLKQLKKINVNQPEKRNSVLKTTGAGGVRRRLKTPPEAKSQATWW